MILVPSPSNMASKDRVNLVSRSRIRKRGTTPISRRSLLRLCPRWRRPSPAVRISVSSRPFETMKTALSRASVPTIRTGRFLRCTPPTSQGSAAERLPSRISVTSGAVPSGHVYDGPVECTDRWTLRPDPQGCLHPGLVVPRDEAAHLPRTGRVGRDRQAKGYGSARRNLDPDAAWPPCRARSGLHQPVSCAAHDLRLHPRQQVIVIAPAGEEGLADPPLVPDAPNVP